MSTTHATRKKENPRPTTIAQPVPLNTDKKKRTRTPRVTTNQRLQRMLARSNPIGTVGRTVEANRKQLGKDVRARRDARTGRITDVKRTALGNYNLLATAPARKTWQEMNADQQKRYENTVKGIIDQYLTSRKTSEMIPLSRIAPPGLTPREHNQRVEEFLRTNPRMKLRNETRGNEAVFERVLTRAEKRTRAADQREFFIEGSLQDVNANIEQLRYQLTLLRGNTTSARRIKNKDHDAREREIEQRITGLINRSTILEGIRQRMREERAHEKVRINDTWRKEIAERKEAERRTKRNVWTDQERAAWREREKEGRAREAAFLEELGGKVRASPPRRNETANGVPLATPQQLHEDAERRGEQRERYKEWETRTPWRRFRKKAFPYLEKHVWDAVAREQQGIPPKRNWFMEKMINMREGYKAYRTRRRARK